MTVAAALVTPVLTQNIWIVLAWSSSSQLATPLQPLDLPLA